MNYFSIFGLPIRYQIDNQKLKFLFQELQRQYHPDKFINGTPLEKMDAVKRSAIINQAWQTLRDPILRAEHLLHLHGFSLEDEQYAMCNIEFLKEQFELREEFENIKREKNEKKLIEFIRRMKEMFNTWSFNMTEQCNHESWDEVVQTVRKLRFIEQLCKNIEQLEEKLFLFNLEKDL